MNSVPVRAFETQSREKGLTAAFFIFSKALAIHVAVVDCARRMHLPTLERP